MAVKHRQPDDALQQLVDSLREEARIPGCVLLVDDGSGQPPLGIESGYSDPANGRAATLGEYYPIGSVTKTFVATLSMRAWQAGLLDLDEDRIDHVADRPHHDRRYALDLDGDAGELCPPARPFEPALEATVRWYVDHPDWWEPLVSLVRNR